MTGNNAVSRKRVLIHPEIVTLVFRHHVQLHETARVQYIFDSLPSRQFARLSLFFQPCFAAPEAGFGLFVLKFG